MAEGAFVTRFNEKVQAAAAAAAVFVYPPGEQEPPETATPRPSPAPGSPLRLIKPRASRFALLQGE